MDEEIIMDESTIRMNLKNERLAHGLTQKVIAEKIGISIPAYQKLERGRTNILNPNFIKCADILGITLAELVNGFVPVRNADRLFTEVQQEYGEKLRIQESGYRSELKERNREIERLESVIKDKEDTIATQKLLIAQLMGKSRN
ncbi:MAG: helix-turn-helix transcriptional regulator [Bacteroidales bacterium]|nr:helix-turn-helix transcriptional regulator [Bacteroidales bacterium]